MFETAKQLTGVVKKLALLPTGLAVVSLFFLMIMTFADVILRSMLNAPIEAASELTRILMVIIVFSSLPIISATGKHIVVDLTDPLFKGFFERLRDGLVDIVAGALLIWPTLRCFTLAERARSFGDLTEFLSIPQFYIAYFIAIATGITAIVMILKGLLTLFLPTLFDQEEGA